MENKWETSRRQARGHSAKPVGDRLGDTVADKVPKFQVGDKWGTHCATKGFRFQMGGTVRHTAGDKLLETPGDKVPIGTLRIHARGTRYHPVLLEIETQQLSAVETQHCVSKEMK